MRTIRVVFLLLALTALFVNPSTINSSTVKFIEEKVTVTAYTPVEMKCAATNCITASGKPAIPGYIAISRDLEKIGLKFGDRVHLAKIGTFEIQDRMHRRKIKSIDVFMTSYHKAIHFGKKKTMLYAAKEAKNAIAS